MDADCMVQGVTNHDIYLVCFNRLLEFTQMESIVRYSKTLLYNLNSGACVYFRYDNVQHICCLCMQLVHIGVF